MHGLCMSLYPTWNFRSQTPRRTLWTNLKFAQWLMFKGQANQSPSYPAWLDYVKYGLTCSSIQPDMYYRESKFWTWPILFYLLSRCGDTCLVATFSKNRKWQVVFQCRMSRGTAPLSCTMNPVGPIRPNLRPRRTGNIPKPWLSSRH